MPVLAVASALWPSGIMFASTDPVRNAGYELVGGIEMWESATLRGGGFDLTGHIEPAWAMEQFDDEQACAEVESTESEAVTDCVEPIADEAIAPKRCPALHADAIIELVQMWGLCPAKSCSSDLTGDGLVETADLMLLLFSHQP